MSRESRDSKAVVELIHGCYNSESEYHIEEITKIKKNNICFPVKGDGMNDAIRVAD